LATSKVLGPCKGSTAYNSVGRGRGVASEAGPGFHRALHGEMPGLGPWTKKFDIIIGVDIGARPVGRGRSRTVRSVTIAMKPVAHRGS